MSKIYTQIFNVVVDVNVRSAKGKIIHNGYVFDFKRPFVSKKMGETFDVFYCSHNRKTKCRVSIRRRAKHGGNFDYFISNDDHHHGIVPPPRPPPPPRPIITTTPSPEKIIVIPIEIEFRHPHGRIYIHDYPTHIKDSRIVFTDENGKSCQPNISQDFTTTPDGYIVFGFDIFGMEMKGWVSVTFSYTDKNDQDFHCRKENAFFFTEDKKRKRMEEEEETSPQKLKRIGGEPSVPSRIVCVCANRGPAPGGQKVDVWFQVQRIELMKRLQREKNVITGCFFGDNSAKIQKKVGGYDEYEFEWDDVCKNSSGFTRADRPDYTLPVKVPPCNAQPNQRYPLTVPVTLVFDQNILENTNQLTIPNGYTYTGEEQDNQISSNLTLKYGDDDDGFRDDGPFDPFFKDDGSGGYSDIFGDLQEENTDQFGANVLFYAIALGRMDIVRKCVEERFFDLTRTDTTGASVLDVAAFFEKNDIYNYLIQKFPKNDINEKKKKKKVESFEDDDEPEEEDEEESQPIIKKKVSLEEAMKKLTLKCSKCTNPISLDLETRTISHKCKTRSKNYDRKGVDWESLDYVHIAFKDGKRYGSSHKVQKTIISDVLDCPIGGKVCCCAHGGCNAPLFTGGDHPLKIRFGSRGEIFTKIV